MISCEVRKFGQTVIYNERSLVMLAAAAENIFLSQLQSQSLKRRYLKSISCMRMCICFVKERSRPPRPLYALDMSSKYLLVPLFLQWYPRLSDTCTAHSLSVCTRQNSHHLLSLYSPSPFLHSLLFFFAAATTLLFTIYLLYWHESSMRAESWFCSLLLCAWIQQPLEYLLKE